jgi:hypothetical protein
VEFKTAALPVRAVNPVLRKMPPDAVPKLSTSFPDDGSRRADDGGVRSDTMMTPGYMARVGIRVGAGSTEIIREGNGWGSAAASRYRGQ